MIKDVEISEIIFMMVILVLRSLIIAFRYAYTSETTMLQRKIKLTKSKSKKNTCYMDGKI